MTRSTGPSALSSARVGEPSAGRQHLSLRRRTGTRPPTVRLRLHDLEDRTAPATYTVTNTLDDTNPGSFRWAITQANAAATNDAINFDAAGVFASPQTINLGSVLPQISNGDLTITSTGASNLTIRRSAGTFGIFSIANSSANVIFDGLTISNGNSGSGGAITASTQNVTVRNCVISGNTGTTAGAIFVPNLQAGILTIQNTTISGNSGRTGGIYFYDVGNLLIQNSTISSNTGTNTSAAHGGGIIFFGAVGSVGVTIENSTIVGNTTASTGGGGGINLNQVTGTVTIRDCTISGNTAPAGASGGGGIGFTSSSPNLIVQNSVIAQNNGPATGPDLRGTAGTATVTNSLIGVIPPSNYTDGGGNKTGTQGLPLNPQLGPLQNNGGPTQTRAPLSGSPVVDAGNNSLLPSGMTNDQRVDFLRKYNGTVDMGAVEDQPAGLPWATSAPTSIDLSGVGATIYSFNVTFADPTGSNQGIATSGIIGNSTAVRVMGPAGYNQLATYVGINNAANGTPRIATYTIVPPGGAWDSSDDGVYTVSIELNQVKDLDNNAIAADAIGSFAVDIRLNNTSWAPIGPAPITNEGPASGRVAGLATDPTDSNIVYAAAAGGGVWKTINANSASPTWTPLTDSQSTLSSGAIAIAPTDHNTVYVGTGEANFALDNLYGRGVLKSTDGGSTWTLLGNSVFNLAYISTVVVDPTDANTVYVAVASGGSGTGIWKSINGGTSWTNVTSAAGFTSSQSYTSLVINPSDRNTLYAAIGSTGGSASNTIIKTTNGGTNWAVAGNINSLTIAQTSFGRIVLALAPSATSTVYGCITNKSTGGLLGFVRTTDAGTTWTVQATSPNHLGNQGWYDTSLMVDPANANIVYAGGAATSTHIMRSTNAAASWTAITSDANGNGPHVDHHAMAIDTAGRLFDGNDGGVWRWDPATQLWKDYNTNLNTIQFTGVAVHPSNAYVAYGGSQDNGTERFSDNLGWTQVIGGDGGFVRVAENSGSTIAATTVYHTYYGVSLEKSTDGGATWSTATSGINTSDASNFYVPYVISKTDPNRLLYGTTRVYRTTNAASSWSAISTVSTNGWGMASSISALGLSESDANTVYAATNSGNIYVTTNGGGSWAQRAPVSMAWADIAVDPTNAQTAYIVAGQFRGSNGNIYKTINGGSSWINITSNLPNWPVNAIQIDPRGPGSADDVLFVGTDKGVYRSIDQGASWSQFGTGLPNAQVVDLDFSSSLKILAAGTHGRGMWEIRLNSAPVGNPESYTTAEDVPLNVGVPGVLGNDTDIDGDALTAAVVTGPTHGLLTLNANGSFTYTPSANYNGADSFVYQVQDGFDRSANTTVNISITPVNDAPVIDTAGNMSLNAVTEDDFASAGTLVSDIIASAGGDRITDADAGALEGLAITAADAANGSWQYSLNNGGAWSALGGVSATSALLLASDANTRIRFIPNADFAGTINPAITFRAWDQTIGSNGATADANTNGGTTAFSALTETASLFVTPVNDAPILDNTGDMAIGTILEDEIANVGTLISAVIASAGGDRITDVDAGAVEGIAVIAADTANGSWQYSTNNGGSWSALGSVSATNARLLAADTNTRLRFVPSLNYNGASDPAITFRAWDQSSGLNGSNADPSTNGGTTAFSTATETGSIIVTAVNDAPTFTKGADQVELEDSGSHSVPGWATSMSVGPPDESGQSFAFEVSTDNDAFFSTLPTINLAGDLSYTLAPDASGLVTVTVKLKDNGGTASGGADTTTVTFAIQITPINDIPSFTKGADQPVLEDAGPQIVPNWATAISKGPPNESGQSLIFLVTTDNDALFATLPAIDASGQLTYTTAANANGSATVTIRLMDDGGTDNGGQDTTGPQTFTITVTAVNDAPSFTNIGNQTVLEDGGLQTIPGWAAGISAGPPDESGQSVDFLATTDNVGLFSVLPAVDATGKLTYTPVPDANGSATVTVKLHDDGGTDSGGQDTSAPQTFVITVTAVNDVPSFTRGADDSALEDGGPQSVPGWAHNISKGPADESGQAVNFLVSTDNDTLFSVLPAIDGSGNLTYTAAPDANGSATITVKIHDDGGIDNGGVDTSAPQTFTITVTAVNDVPSFLAGASQTVDEDPGPRSVNTWATALSAGPPNESAQSLSFEITGNTNPALFSAGPAVASDGTLNYTLAPDANGSATIQVRIKDSGGTDDGGVDASPPQSFTITVRPVNDAPVAQLDQGDAVAKKPLKIAVLANDYDVDGDSLTMIGFTNPTKGTIQRVGNSFTYTTRLITAATDSFTYTISDGHGGVTVGTVNVRIVDVLPPTVKAVRLYYGPNEYVDAGSLTHSSLPWAKIYKVAVQFSEDVTADPAALTLNSPSGVYATSFSYDAENRLATWTPAAPIGMGRLTIRLFASDVADSSANHPLKSWSGSFGLLAGDFDGNGVVDKRDQSAIKRRFSRPKKPIVRLADLNGDGIVSQADYDLAKANLGKRLQ